MSQIQELEERVDRLDRRITEVSVEAATARLLATKTDHDIADMQQRLRAHTRSLNALHQTQSEQLQQLKELRSEMQGGFADVDARFKGIDGRLEGIDARLGGIDRRLDTYHAETKEGFAAVNARFDQVESRFQSGFDELAALIKRSGKTA